MRKRIMGMVMALAISAGCLPAAPVSAKTVIYPTKATGEVVEENDQCVIDYSNCKDGYVVVKYKQSTAKIVKAQVKKGKRTYTYTLCKQSEEVLPLSEGNGTYKITVFLQLKGDSYATVGSASVDVKMSSKFAPFLRPNQYVKFNKSTKYVKKAASLTKKCKNDLAKVKKIYKYVIKNMKYDNKKAKNVKTGYLPNLNSLYKKKKGICFDYAAVMTAMLRSQGVPTKLVIGYTGNTYHAWINVYSKKKGWITGAIYISGKKWKLMDPTFASTGKSSKSIMKYIENKKNYKAQYSY
ncbi:MAG: transglutaminase domain-containing protein [Eubacterium sp.]|nr:transglutaminase domain-containing protein [Eubacterium sp.]